MCCEKGRIAKIATEVGDHATPLPPMSCLGSRAADVESNERQGALGCTKTAKRNANRNELEKLYNKQHGAAGDLIWEIGLKVDRKIGEN